MSLCCILECILSPRFGESQDPCLYKWNLLNHLHFSSHVQKAPVTVWHCFQENATAFSIPSVNSGCLHFLGKVMSEATAWPAGRTVWFSVERSGSSVRHTSRKPIIGSWPWSVWVLWTKWPFMSGGIAVWLYEPWGTLSAYKNQCVWWYMLNGLDFLKEVLLFPLMFLAKLFAKGKRASQSGRGVKLHLLEEKMSRLMFGWVGCMLWKSTVRKRRRWRYGWELKEQEKKQRQQMRLMVIICIVDGRHCWANSNHFTKKKE